MSESCWCALAWEAFSRETRSQWYVFASVVLVVFACLFALLVIVVFLWLVVFVVVSFFGGYCKEGRYIHRYCREGILYDLNAKIACCCLAFDGW